jgi:hypothetical protein
MDGFDIALDNCITGHITFSKDDFIEGTYIKYVDGKLGEGVSGLTSATGHGPVKWMLLMIKISCTSSYSTMSTMSPPLHCDRFHHSSYHLTLKTTRKREHTSPVDYYKPSANDNAAPSAAHHQVTFADPIATVAPSKGATLAIPPKGDDATSFAGAVLPIPAMPPKILLPIHTHRSRRIPKPISKLSVGCLALLVLPNHYKPTALPPLHSFAAIKANKDTMMYWQCLKEPDKPQFVEAMQKEISAHTTNMHWELMPNASIDKANKPLQAVWAMKQKRIPGTGAISKYTARLNTHGRQQELSVNYWDTYAPVV